MEKKRLFEAIMKIANERDELRKKVKRQEFEIASLNQVHDCDVQMIDDTKGKAVELYNRIDEKDEVIKKQKETIEYLRRSCNRKESKLIEEEQELVELDEKDKIIDLMAEEISQSIINTCPLGDYNYNLDCENKCNNDYKECWKQYFKNKVKEVK